MAEDQLKQVVDKGAKDLLEAKKVHRCVENVLKFWESVSVPTKMFFFF